MCSLPRCRAIADYGEQTFAKSPVASSWTSSGSWPPLVERYASHDRVLVDDPAIDTELRARAVSRQQLLKCTIQGRAHLIAMQLKNCCHRVPFLYRPSWPGHLHFPNDLRLLRESTAL
jgi:hypothetical protein